MLYLLFPDNIVCDIAVAHKLYPRAFIVDFVRKTGLPAHGLLFFRRWCAKKAFLRTEWWCFIKCGLRRETVRTQFCCGLLARGIPEPVSLLYRQGGRLTAGRESAKSGRR